MIEITKDDYKLIKDLNYLFTNVFHFVNEKEFVNETKKFFKKLIDDYENEAVIIPCPCGQNEGLVIDNSGALGVLRCAKCKKPMEFKAKGDNTLTIIREEKE